MSNVCIQPILIKYYVFVFDIDIFYLPADDLDAILTSLVTHSGDKWLCLKCGKTVKTRQHIKVHAETHVEGIEHICGYCGRKFKTSNTLQNHISLQHKNLLNN